MLKLVQDASARAEEAPTTIGLDELCRLAAQEMLAPALLAERQAYLDAHADLVDGTGKRLVVGNGYAKEREVTTGAGMVEVKAPRVDDRREGQHYRSVILPAYMRKSPKVTEVLPVLYLRGLSTGDFAPALGEFFGSGAGLSASTVPGSPSPGRTSASAGPAGTCLAPTTCTGGRTGCTSTSASRRTACAAWSSSASAPTAPRSWSPWPTATGSQKSPGPPCCAASASGAWPARCSPWATGRSASGPPCGTSSRPPKNRGAGCTRLPTVSTRYQNAFSHKPNPPSRPSTTPASRTEALDCGQVLRRRLLGLPQGDREDHGRARHPARLLRLPQRTLGAPADQ